MDNSVASGALYATAYAMGISEANPDTILLFKAILDDNIKDLGYALNKQDIDINLQNRRGGETPLLLSLKMKRNNTFIMHFIQAGCDINIPDKLGVTPLHVAVSRPSVDITCELIKRNAHINATNGYDKTPLFHAIEARNLEAVHMLLSYQADYTSDVDRILTLKYAIDCRAKDIILLLIDRFDDSCFKLQPNIIFSNDLLHLKSSSTALLVTIFYEDDRNMVLLFVIVWNKMNSRNLLDGDDIKELLVMYIKFSRHEACLWLECLYLILDASRLKQNCLHTCEAVEHFFGCLIRCFKRKHIELNDRMAIINACLSIGIPVTPNDYQDVHQIYGFGEELEALIYTKNYDKYNAYLSWDLCTITYFVLPMEEGFNYTLFFKLLKKHINDSKSLNIGFPLVYFIKLLGFSSLPPKVKQEIKILHQNFPCIYQQQVFARLEQIPEFPTLFELCRNEIRKYTKWPHRIQHPYQFHDCVKKFKVPEIIQDIIRFKKPLY